MAARAQQSVMPVVGYLNLRSSLESQKIVSAFRDGLREGGFVEGQNVVIEFRWADGRYNRLAALAEDLVARQVAVIATGGGLAPAIAAKSATKDIPIVFSGGSDPVADGLVASLNRPGGNVTGVLNIVAELTAKRLELLNELAPTSASIAMLRNPANAEGGAQVQAINAAAKLIGKRVHIATARTERDFEPAFATLLERGSDALFIAPDPFFASRRRQLVELVARHRIPAIFPQREYAEAGGVMSYGTNFTDVYRQAGVYTGRILRGEKPANLPVMRPARFELLINLKTAKALDLTVPDKLLALADEVIE